MNFQKDQKHHESNELLEAKYLHSLMIMIMIITIIII